MAEQELKIKVSEEGLEDTTNKLNEFNDGLNQTAESSAVASDSNKTLFETFNELGAGLGGAITAFKEVYGAISAATQEISRQSGIMNNLAGSIDEASQRINGLVSNIDLMEARNRIAATGLSLSEHQFANLTVAAQRYSEATGRDLTSSMEQLTEAISEGSVEQLQKFGLELADTTSQAETQESALSSLEQQYGNLDATSGGLNGTITSLNVALDNTKTEFIAGIEQGGSFDTTMTELGDSVIGLANAFGFDLVNGLGLATSAGQIFSAGFNVMVRIMSRLIDALTEFGNFNFDRAAAALSSIANIPEQIGAEIAGQQAFQATTAALRQGQQERTAATTRGAGRTGGGGGGGSAQEEETIADSIARAREQQELFNQIYQDSVDLEQERLDLVREIEAAKNEGTAAEFQRTQELQRQNDELKRQQEIIAKQRLEEEQRAKTQTRMQMGLQGTNTLLQEGLNIAQIAHKDGKTAAKEAMKEWLKNFALQEVLKGGTSLAEAIGLSFTNPPAAGAKYSEAGYHFALAASAGGASAAIKGSGGVGGGGNNTEAPQTKPGTEKPTGGGEAAMGTVIINVNGQSLLTEGQIGREINNALKAYQVKYT